MATISYKNKKEDRLPTNQILPAGEKNTVTTLPGNPAENQSAPVNYGTGTDIYSMSDSELLNLAAKNSADWFNADDAGKAALHGQNVDIYGLLDKRNGTTTDYDFGSGSWNARPKTESGAVGYSALPGGSFNYSRENDYQRAMNAVLNPETFSYDLYSDPMYKQYREQYTREGDRAMRDTYGQVAARTGGLGSSYAATAAAQADQYYLSKLNDVIPTLYQQAYNRYLQEYQNKLSGLDALRADRSGEYSIYSDALDREIAREQEAYNRGREKEQTEYNRLQAEKSLARDQIDAILKTGGTPSSELLAAAGYSGDYVSALAAYYQEQNAREEEDRRRDTADWLAGYGDLSGLAGEGIDTSWLEEDRENERTKRQRDTADWLAGYGDLSGLEGMGVNTLYQKAIQDAQLAKLGAGSGKSGSGGSGTSYKKSDDKTGENEIISMALTLYPDGVVTNLEDWKALLSIYDEERLGKMGLRFDDGTKTNSPEVNQDIYNLFPGVRPSAKEPASPQLPSDYLPSDNAFGTAFMDALSRAQGMRALDAGDEDIVKALKRYGPMQLTDQGMRQILSIVGFKD